MRFATPHDEARGGSRWKQMFHVRYGGKLRWVRLMYVCINAQLCTRLTRTTLQILCISSVYKRAPSQQISKTKCFMVKSSACWLQKQQFGVISCFSGWLNGSCVAGPQTRSSLMYYSALKGHRGRKHKKNAQQTERPQVQNDTATQTIGHNQNIGVHVNVATVGSRTFTGVNSTGTVTKFESNVSDICRPRRVNWIEGPV